MPLLHPRKAVATAALFLSMCCLALPASAASRDTALLLSSGGVDRGRAGQRDRTVALMRRGGGERWARRSKKEQPGCVIRRPEEGSCPSCCSMPPAAAAHPRRCRSSTPACGDASRPPAAPSARRRDGPRGCAADRHPAPARAHQPGSHVDLLCRASTTPRSSTPSTPAAPRWCRSQARCGSEPRPAAEQLTPRPPVLVLSSDRPAERDARDCCLRRRAEA